MEDLRWKYRLAIATAKNGGLTGFIGERDGRLLFKGSVETDEQATKIWNAIKDVPSWHDEVIAEIQVTGTRPSHRGTTGDKPA